jgi:potassium/hydrogen antiporter
VGLELDANSAFIAIAISIFIGFAANFLFRKYGAPDILFLILLGFLFGPGMLGLIDQSVEESIGLITPFVGGIALAIVMFEAGMELNVKQVLGAFRPALFHSILAFVLSLVTTALICMLVMGWDLLVAMTMGGAVAATSGAIVVPLVKRIQVSEKTRIVLTLEAAISEALSIAVTIILILIIRDGSMSAGMALRIVGGTFLVSAALGFGVGILWLFALSRLSGQPFAYMITLGTLLLIYALADVIAGGVGGGVIAALTFGLVLGNEFEVARALRMKNKPRRVDKKVKDFNSEISFFVRTFFFVYLGILCSLIDFTMLTVILALIIFASLVAVRYVATLVQRERMNLHKTDSAAHLFLMPRGLVAAVLASLPLSFGVVSEEIGYTIIGATVLVIILSTSLASFGTYVIHSRFH